MHFFVIKIGYSYEKKKISQGFESADYDSAVKIKKSKMADSV